MVNEKDINPLSKLATYKEDLINIFMNDSLVQGLVMPVWEDNTFSEKQNWRGGTYTNKNGITKELIGHCFDVPFIDTTLSKEIAAIFIEDTISELKENSIQSMSLQIMIICHKKMLYLDNESRKSFESIGYYGNRVDMLVQVINSIFLQSNKKSDKFGIGKLRLDTRNPVRTYVPNSEFYGRVMNYTIYDFNKTK